MRCQLVSNNHAELIRDLRPGERVYLRVIRLRRKATDLMLKLLSPQKVMRRVRKILGTQRVSLAVIQGEPIARHCEMATLTEGSGRVTVEPLKLQAGERVRVKTYEEVLKTLDADDRYQGCTFTSAMTRFCGQTFAVANRIEHFFDERNGKLMKAKDMVILEGVHCHVPADSFQRFAGCDRRCYLFWKEAWLERVAV